LICAGSYVNLRRVNEGVNVMEKLEMHGDEVKRVVVARDVAYTSSFIMIVFLYLAHILDVVASM